MHSIVTFRVQPPSQGPTSHGALVLEFRNPVDLDAVALEVFLDHETASNDSSPLLQDFSSEYWTTPERMETICQISDTELSISRSDHVLMVNIDSGRILWDRSRPGNSENDTDPFPHSLRLTSLDSPEPLFAEFETDSCVGIYRIRDGANIARTEETSDGFCYFDACELPHIPALAWGGYNTFEILDLTTLRATNPRVGEHRSNLAAFGYHSILNTLVATGDQTTTMWDIRTPIHEGEMTPFEDNECQCGTGVSVGADRHLILIEPNNVMTSDDPRTDPYRDFYSFYDDRRLDQSLSRAASPSAIYPSLSMNWGSVSRYVGEGLFAIGGKSWSRIVTFNSSFKIVDQTSSEIELEENERGPMTVFDGGLGFGELGCWEVDRVEFVLERCVAKVEIRGLYGSLELVTFRSWMS